MAGPIFRQGLWLLLLLVGLCSSLLGMVVDYWIDVGLGVRHDVLTLTVDHPVARLLLWLGWSVCLCCGAVWVTRNYSPEAVGSGIPQMKAILAGGINSSRAEAYLSWRCLVVKAVGLVFAKVAGLSIGKEGPWVHISAALAHNVANWPSFAPLCLHRESWRQIISAGFAAGTAANFGAPIGGVLFSIEVTATHYPVSSYIKAFACSVSGAFFLRFFGGTSSHKKDGGGYNSGGALFTMLDDNGSVQVFHHERHELFAFALLGLCAGVAGAGFVTFHRLVVVRFRPLKSDHPYLLSAAVAALSALLSFPEGTYVYAPN